MMIDEEYGAVYVDPPEKTPQFCKHNLGVICTGQNRCDGCGWNPEMEVRRKAAVRKKLKEAGNE